MTSLDLSADLSVTLGGLRDEFRKDRKHRDWTRVASTPIDIEAQSQIVATTAGPNVIGLGGPAMGRARLVREIVVGGVTVATAAAGTADVYVMGTSPGATPPLIRWRDHAATMPLIAFYSDRQIALHYPEKLWVVLTGATNGQQYVAAAWSVDYQEAAVGEQFSL